MAVKLSSNIPEIWDMKDEKQMRDWMVAVKQCVEELARKAQPLQEELRTSVPTVSDIEEGEQVRHTNNNIYTKLNGVIRVIATA